MGKGHGSGCAQAGLAQERKRGGRAGHGEKACGPNEEERGEKKEILFLFPNNFSKLIFNLNLNSIQILVKANHYKNKCAAA